MTPTTSTLPCGPRLSVAGRRFHDSLAMLCTVGLDGRITEANASLLSALDTTEADLLGSSSLDRPHPADRAATLDRAEELLLGVDVTTFEPCRAGRLEHGPRSFRLSRVARPHATAHHAAPT